MQKLAIFGGTFNPVHYGHLLMAETALTQFALDQVIWVPAYQPPHKSTGELVDFHHRLNMVRQVVASHPQFTCSDIEGHLSRRGSLANYTEPFDWMEVVDRSDRTNSVTSSYPLDRTYAVDTFTALQSQYPQGEWYWLLGVDAFRSLAHWYRYRDFVSRCHWLIAPRPELAVPTTAQSHSEPTQKTAISAPLPAKTCCVSALDLCEQVAQTLAEQSIELNWHLLSMPLIEISSGLIRNYCCNGRSIRYLVPDPVRDYISTHRLYLNPDREEDLE
jgi:nicotinate-nucleotide adenylyltransferase